MARNPDRPYASVDWSTVPKKQIPGIRLKLSPETYHKVALLADGSGQGLNQTIISLLETVLPYAEVKEVMVPKKTMVIAAADRTAWRR